MQGYSETDSFDIRKLGKIIRPVLILGLVAIISPFAILLNNVPPSNPPLLGQDSSVRIYLWAAWFSVGGIHDRFIIGGGVTQLDALPFVILVLIYCIVQVIVSTRKILAKDGILIEIVLFLIWVAFCQLIYGTLQDWTLIQIPLLPIAGIYILLVAYRNQCKH